MSGFASSLRKKEDPVTLLNVAKCSVPRLCAELRAFGRFDEAEEEDGARWKQFKDIETALWLADHKQRQKDEEAGLSQEQRRARDRAAAEAARAAIAAIQEKELAEQKRGITKTSETGGTVPRADWAWSMSNAAAAAAAAPKRDASKAAGGMGLSFQEIQKYDLFTLRTKMDECGLFESMHKAKEAYKACEELMAKLVKVLLDPTAKRLDVVGGDGAGAAEENEDNKKSTAALGGAVGAAAALAAPAAVRGANASTLSVAGERSNEPVSSDTPRVRRGDEITLENVPSLTLYELRQELERRGAFGDFLSQKKTINFNNMLKVMQSVLLAEKEARDAERAAEVWEKPEDIKARLAQAKADRKAEALERSRLRQIERKKEEAAAAAKAEEEEEEEAAKDGEGEGVEEGEGHAKAEETPAAKVGC